MRKIDPRRRARQALSAVLVVVVLALTACAIQAVRVREAYGDWGLWPGAHSPRIHFHGRNYLRDDGATPVPAGAVVLGTAPGSGTVLSSPPIAGYAPTVLYVRYPDRTVTVYVLSGGP